MAFSLQPLSEKQSAMADLNSFKTKFENPANFSLIFAVVSTIVEVYAPATTSPIVIGHYANSKVAHMEHNHLVENILVRVSTQVTIRILLEVNNNYDSYEHELDSFGKDMNNEEYFYRIFQKKDKAIWFVDSLSSFERLKADLVNERSHFLRNGFFCIIYTGREPKRFDIIHFIFRQLFEIFVININILITSKDMVYVYTYFPFTINKCSDTKPRLYNIFGPLTKYRFKQQRFFSKKLLDMKGCKVKVTTWNIPPFMFLEYNNHTGVFESLKGIEGMLMMLLAEHMNFTVQLVKEPNQNRGEYFPNGTATGATKMLIDGETDIFLACLMYDKGRKEIFELAYSYLSVPLKLGIPKGKLMSPFERLYRPFRYIIWSLLSSSVAFGVFFIYLLKALCNARVQEFVFGRNNRIPFTNLWNSFFGGPIATALPRRNFARYLLAIWIIYTWILRSAYIGQLFFILQDSRGRITLTMIEETVKQNFTFFTYPVIVPTLKGLTSDKINIVFVDNKENSLPKILKILSEDENANAAITLLSYILRYYNQNPNNRKHRVNILNEPILNSPITFCMRKHSFLAFEIHEILLNIMSAGLLNRFEDLYLNKFSHSDEQEPTLISVWLLFGLFSIYICLLILSTLVFLLELWSKHSRLTKKVMDFLNI